MGDTISSLVFRPPKPTPMRRSRYFWIDTKCDNGTTGRIAAFFIKRRGANLTLIFSHGNAEDLGMMFTRMKEIALVFRVNILAYDYSGYGKSTGSPSEQNCYYNIEAAFKYLVEGRGIQPEQIVLYGRSLGSGPTCHLAAKTASKGRSIGGVILHSPFLSIFRIVIDPGFTMAGDMFKNLDNAPKIRCPVLLIHGTQDEIVPFWHSQELLNRLPPPCRVRPLWADGLGHNSIEVYMRNLYVSTIRNFFERYISSSGGQILPPLPVPEEERADENFGSSCVVKVNHVWIRHGATMVNEAMYPRSSDEARSALSSSRADVDENEYRDDDTQTIYTDKTGLYSAKSKASAGSLKRRMSSFSKR